MTRALLTISIGAVGLSAGMVVAATSVAPTVGSAAAGPVSASSAKVSQTAPGPDICGKVSDTGARKMLCPTDG